MLTVAAPRRVSVPLSKGLVPPWISWIRHLLMQVPTQFKLIYFCLPQDLRRLVMEQGKIIEQLMKRVHVSIERQRVSPCKVRSPVIQSLVFPVVIVRAKLYCFSTSVTSLIWIQMKYQVAASTLCRMTVY